MADPKGPILCIDVQYVETPAATTGYSSGVLFAAFDASRPLAVFTVVYPNVAPYEAGAFFKRELGPVQAVIAASPAVPGVVVVDGFVDLAAGKPGLGRHLYAQLGGVPVIGVAKNPFRDGRREGKEVADHGTGERAPEAASAPENDPGRSPAPASPDSGPETLPKGAILRGSSSRPLYITAAGVSQEDAERLVQKMHGRNRIPTMLKLVDAEARRAAKEAGQGGAT